MEKLKGNLEIAAGLLIFALGGLVLICVGLWWTGWASALPEPAWEIVRWGAVAGGAAFVALLALALASD